MTNPSSRNGSEYIRPVMRASDAIAKLQQLIDEHGDKRLSVMSDTGCEDGIEFITPRHTPGTDNGVHTFLIS